MPVHRPASAAAALETKASVASVEALAANPIDLAVARIGNVLPATPNGTYVLVYSGIVLASNAAAGYSAFRFDPARYTVPTGKTLKMRMDWNCQVNAVAPAQSYQCRLFPITAVAGAAAANTVTLGAALGTGITFTTPAANSITDAFEEFNAPAAGLYAPGFIVTAASAASSSVLIIPRVSVRAA